MQSLSGVVCNDVSIHDVPFHEVINLLPSLKGGLQFQSLCLRDTGNIHSLTY